MRKLYNHLMFGVSKSFPILIAGSFILAISRFNFLHNFVNNDFLEILDLIGENSIKLFVVLLCGGIAKSIAGDIGLGPGLVTGVTAFITNTGVLGSIILGFTIGCLVNEASKHKKVEDLFFITVVVPIITTIVATFYLLYISQNLLNLYSMISSIYSGLSMIVKFILGSIFGILMIIDLGGPINKLNSLFLNSLFIQGFYVAAIIKIASAMVAPVGIGIGNVILGRKEGLNLIKQGLLFITESLIPVKEQYKTSVSVATIIGSLLTGGLLITRNIEMFALHGGFIMTLTINRFGEFILIFLIGIILTTLLYLFMSSINKRNSVKNEIEENDFDLNEYMEEI